MIPRDVGLQATENKALSRGIIGKSAPQLTEITIRKSQARFEEEWNDAFTHIVSVYQLTKAVSTILDRTNLTPEQMRFAYWDIRCALDGLGFTRQREQEIHEEEEERMEDVRFLRENGTCFPE
jgi:hypothetical protein